MRKKLLVGLFFSDQFRKVIMRYKRIGYNIDVTRQSARLVINPITVDSYAMRWSHFVCVLLSPFGIECGMWDVIVLVPDHCLSIYFRL